ncbi:MAG TPA: hypothetical protein VNO22_16480 [Planctomycetota bacterium]|jgi:aryl-alcohol dehydrogenase-like predicted oxidoreductase|nr:hypothetical protein [Planctomycetota bacterium]
MNARRMGAILGGILGGAAGLAAASEVPAAQALLRALAAAALGYGLGSVVFGPFGRGLLEEGAAGGAGAEKDSIGTPKG